MQLSLEPRQQAPDIQVLKILGVVLAVHLALAWLMLFAPTLPLPPKIPAITIDISAALPEQRRGLEEPVEAQSGQNAAASRPPAPRAAAKSAPTAPPAKPEKPLMPSPPKSETAPTKTVDNVAPVAPPPEPMAAAMPSTTSQAVPKGQTDVTQETVRTSEPDLQAAYKDNPKPPYPKAAFRAGAEGTVEIAVVVNSDGSVASAVVALSSGHELLDKSALETVKGWRFKSARKDGVLTKSAVRVPITFRLRAAR